MLDLFKEVPLSFHEFLELKKDEQADVLDQGVLEAGDGIYVTRLLFSCGTELVEKVSYDEVKDDPLYLEETTDESPWKDEGPLMTPTAVLERLLEKIEAKVLEGHPLYDGFHFSK